MHFPCCPNTATCKRNSEQLCLWPRQQDLGPGIRIYQPKSPKSSKSWGLENCIPRLDMLGMFFRIFLGILGIVCIRFWHGSPCSIFSTVRSAVKSNLGSKSQDVTGINIYIYCRNTVTATTHHKRDTLFLEPYAHK